MRVTERGLWPAGGRTGGVGLLSVLLAFQAPVAEARSAQPIEEAVRLEAIGNRLVEANGGKCTASAGCSRRFFVVPGGALNASADGRRVSVSRGMIRFAEEDDALAFVVAHEMAHNILKHAQRLKGIPSGFIDAENAARVKETEIEADVLAVEMVAKAGYDPRASERLLTRLSRHLRGHMLATHPGLGQRIALVRGEMAKLEQKRMNDMPQESKSLHH